MAQPRNQGGNKPKNNSAPNFERLDQLVEYTINGVILERNRSGANIPKVQNDFRVDAFVDNVTNVSEGYIKYLGLIQKTDRNNKFSTDVQTTFDNLYGNRSLFEQLERILDLKKNDSRFQASDRLKIKEFMETVKEAYVFDDRIKTTPSTREYELKPESIAKIAGKISEKLVKSFAQDDELSGTISDSAKKVKDAVLYNNKIGLLKNIYDKFIYLPNSMQVTATDMKRDISEVLGRIQKAGEYKGEDRKKFLSLIDEYSADLNRMISQKDGAITELRDEYRRDIDEMTDKPEREARNELERVYESSKNEVVRIYRTIEASTAKLSEIANQSIVGRTYLRPDQFSKFAAVFDLVSSKNDSIEAFEELDSNGGDLKYQLLLFQAQYSLCMSRTRSVDDRKRAIELFEKTLDGLRNLYNQTDPTTKPDLSQKLASVAGKVAKNIGMIYEQTFDKDKKAKEYYEIAQSHFV